MDLNWYTVHFKILIMIIMMTGGLQSCHQRSVPAVEPEKEERIIFISLRIIKESGNNEQIELIEKIWADGKLKGENKINKEGPPFLVCEFLDSDKKKVKSIEISNPLKASREQFSPDGTIQRKQPVLEKAIFSIRESVSLNTAFLRIVNENGQEIGFITLQ